MFNPSTTVTSNAPTLRRSSRIMKKIATSKRTTTPHLATDKDQFKSSTLAGHTQETGHHINWSDFRIVWRDENPYGLFIKESLLIQAFQPELNRTTNLVLLIVFPDGLPRQMLPDPNVWFLNNSINQLVFSLFLSIPLVISQFYTRIFLRTRT